MIIALAVGLAAGIVLSLPPGPIAVAVIHQALDGRLRRGIGIAAGAATMDACYTLVAVYASSAFVTSLKSFIVDNPWVLLAVQVVAVVTFVLMGLHYIRINPGAVKKAEEREHRQEERAERLGAGRNSYVNGIVMSIINLPSPTFLPSLIALAAWMHAQGYIGTSVGANVLYSIGFGLGAGTWFIIILRLLRMLRSKLSATFITRIYQFTGASFFVFAVVLVVNVILSTDWGHLFGT